MKKGVIFDMDGLMVDTEVFYFQVERDIGKKYGKDVEESLLHRMMGQKPLDSMKMFVNELGIDEDPAVLLAERDERILEAIRSQLTPMPGLFELLEALRPVAKLGIGTGNTWKMVDEVLCVLGLRGVFDFIQTSDTVKVGKPSPEIFEKACDGLGLEVSRVAVLEDSANGIRAAWAAGCLPLAVPNRYTRAQDFSLAHRVFSSLFEAKEFLLEWVVQ
ncbi:MAG: HAD family phosphatase [Brevinematales bacterium]|nr:HAD family phosphatase [Brevinematales bacterium]